MEAYELKPEPLEIKQPLSFIESGRRYSVKHFLRVPTLADWAAYDGALQITVEDAEGGGMRHRDSKVAALALLWERLVLRVEGYAVPSETASEPRAPASGGWKDCVPYSHRVAAAAPRALVVAIPAPIAATASGGEPGAQGLDAVLYTPGQQEVHLLAAGGDYGALVHCFRQPEAPQVIQFNRLHADRIYLRATKREPGKSIIPSQLAAYCGLYDQLITEVRGYSINNAPCTGREQAVQAMDGWHKQAALKGLFLPPVPEPEEPESEEAAA